MDIISFNEAATANGRIEKFIKDPDSDSGIVTTPAVIETGETVTIPSGRIATLPNLQIDGTLNVDGEVFIPSGSTLSGTVTLDTAQTVTEVKTFTKSPIVPTPTLGVQVANKDYVDNSATLNINALTNKATPIVTDNLVIQETGGLLKKVSFGNLKTNINNILQVVYAENKVVGSGSLAIPADGTIPQITEGNEILTCTITPKKANSKLLIEFTPSCQTLADIGNVFTVACFRNGVSDALYQIASTNAYINIGEMTLTGRFVVSTPTTSPITFSLRAGEKGGSIRWNQIKYSTTETMNTSTTMTITEIA